VSQGQTAHDPRHETGGWLSQVFAVFGGAFAWVVHFLGSYAFVTIGCMSRLPGIGPIVGVGTFALAGVAAWSAILAWRDWRRVSDGQRWNDALSEPRGWFAWLMMLGVLVGGFAAFTIVLQGIGAVLLPVCEAHRH
jgi:hypothetical protein